MNFKKRVNGSWTDTPHYIRNTSTDTITTLPTVIYPTDTTATVGLKGQTLQSSIPSPTSPVMPEGCGDLETSGEKAGQYKIPISSANTTTPVYLGEVQSTRRIKKLVLTGDEGFVRASNGTFRLGITYNALKVTKITTVCSHYISTTNRSGLAGMMDNRVCCSISSNEIWIRDESCADATAFKTWLASEYANGTPVTVWYVLATPTTSIVNEPIRKIGDYADEVSGITIPTIAGADTLSVDTTLQPSEVTVNYHGWHPVQSVHEKSRNLCPKGNWVQGQYRDGVWEVTDTRMTSDYIPVSQMQYTMSINNGQELSFININIFDSSKTWIGNRATIGMSPFPATSQLETTPVLPNNAAFIRLTVRAYNEEGYPTQEKIDNSNIMLNSGSTALPYEPYWK